MDTALHFSGGKDSLACLFLYRDQWDEILVCWLNTGAAYPEVVKSMASWRERLPHFLEIKSDQPEQIKRYGFPSDVVPINWTLLGHGIGFDHQPRIQSYLSCCEDNIWMPMAQKMHELGIKRIIRGQKKTDARKAPIRNWENIAGVEYVFPLAYWTDGDVIAYLQKNDALPSYYETERSSHDCWDCTAYLDENMERIANLPPEMRSIVKDRLDLISGAIKEASHAYG